MFRALRKRIFHSDDYYRHVFSNLEPGEILEWYNTDLLGLSGALRLFPSDIVLDVGCGTSMFSSQCLQKRTFSVGVDRSIQALRIQRDLGISSVRADALKLPFRDSSIDVVIEKGLVDALLSGGIAIKNVEDELFRVAKRVCSIRHAPRQDSLVLFERPHTRRVDLPRGVVAFMWD